MPNHAPPGSLGRPAYPEEPFVSRPRLCKAKLGDYDVIVHLQAGHVVLVPDNGGVGEEAAQPSQEPASSGKQPLTGSARDDPLARCGGAQVGGERLPRKLGLIFSGGGGGHS